MKLAELAQLSRTNQRKKRQMKNEPIFHAYDYSPSLLSPYEWSVAAAIAESASSGLLLTFAITLS